MRPATVSGDGRARSAGADAYPTGCPAASTARPRSRRSTNLDGTVDPHKMVVLDAPSVGSSPMASTIHRPSPTELRRSSRTVPDALQDLNMCYSFGADDGFSEPKLRPGSCRHNVVDRTRDYISGSMTNLAGAAANLRAFQPRQSAAARPDRLRDHPERPRRQPHRSSGGHLEPATTCTCGAQCQLAEATRARARKRGQATPVRVS